MTEIVKEHDNMYFTSILSEEQKFFFFFKSPFFFFHSQLLQLKYIDDFPQILFTVEAETLLTPTSVRRQTKSTWEALHD